MALQFEDYAGIVKNYDKKNAQPLTLADTCKILKELRFASNLKKVELVNTFDELERSVLIIEQEIINKEIVKYEAKHALMWPKKLLRKQWKLFKSDKSFTNLSLVWTCCLFCIHPRLIEMMDYYFSCISIFSVFYICSVGLIGMYNVYWELANRMPMFAVLHVTINLLYFLAKKKWQKNPDLFLCPNQN